MQEDWRLQNLPLQRIPASSQPSGAFPTLEGVLDVLAIFPNLKVKANERPRASVLSVLTQKGTSMYPANQVPARTLVVRSLHCTDVAIPFPSLARSRFQPGAVTRAGEPASSTLLPKTQHTKGQEQQPPRRLRTFPGPGNQNRRRDRRGELSIALSMSSIFTTTRWAPGPPYHSLPSRLDVSLYYQVPPVTLAGRGSSYITPSLTSRPIDHPHVRVLFEAFGTHLGGMSANTIGEGLVRSCIWSTESSEGRVVTRQSSLTRTQHRSGCCER